ncbi:MAG TPA: fibronectin type III domain-containing protein [Actinomycetota bacterium]|nr:fibronectin type III domain-containing protein [Actinomycetota bacterium]
MKIRFLALTALTAIVAAASPAWAGNISSTMTSPGNGAVATGNVSVKGYVESPDGIQSMSLHVAGTQVSALNPSGTKAELSYIWNSNYAPGTQSLIANGDYSAYIEATSKAGESTISEIIILVDNPPRIPTGISVSADDATVRVSWSTNPEPDITGYRVERNSGGGWVAATTTSDTTYFETPGGGNHEYRVTALRSSPTSGTRSSIPSTTSGAFVNGSPSSGTTSNDGGFGSGTDTGSGDGGAFGNVGGIGGPDSGNVSLRGLNTIGKFGLPSGLALPGITGLAGIPSLPQADQFGWGTYEEELPYNLPEGQSQLFTEELHNVAAIAPDRIIPPDGLRWVAAGLLLLVGATMLRFGAVRLGAEPAMAAAAVPAPKSKKDRKAKKAKAVAAPKASKAPKAPKAPKSRRFNNSPGPQITAVAPPPPPAVTWTKETKEPIAEVVPIRPADDSSERGEAIDDPTPTLEYLRARW